MERFDTIVIGGSQAGLVAGYRLAKEGRRFVILDAGARVGDAWRNRWDSLRLFTPARFSHLPGLRHEGPQHVAVTKDQMADYLEAYAQRFALPVRLGVRVTRLGRAGGGYAVETDHGTLQADNVIVATGAFKDPKVPGFADDLDPAIRQIHSSAYRSPADLKPGPVLIVGAGNSGADISLEVAGTHDTILVGRHPGHVPFRIDTFKARYLVRVVRFVGQHVITRRTPLGRKLAAKLGRGGNPLVRVKPKDILAAGVTRITGRLDGVKDGKPVLDDGMVLDVANVIWCTGFHTRYPWIDLPVFDEDGFPVHERGIAPDAPGLYFLGLPFQFSATSEVIVGVVRDSRYVVKHMARAGTGVRAASPSAATT